jgi:hypothetical protein
MPQIKQAAISRIYAELDNNHFTRSDFDLKFPDQGNTLVEIRLRINKAYSFLIKEDFPSSAPLLNAAMLIAADSRRRNPITHEAPGDFKAIEVLDHGTFDEAVRRIRLWCNNVMHDLRAQNPMLDGLEEMQKRLEDQIQEHLSDPDAHFTARERDALNTRLDEMLSKFADLQTRHEITADQLEAVKQDLSAIKQSAQALPKGAWASLAKNRLLWMCKKVGDSPHMKQLAVDVAKHLLTGPK